MNVLSVRIRIYNYNHTLSGKNAGQKNYFYHGEILNLRFHFFAPQAHLRRRVGQVLGSQKMMSGIHHARYARWGNGVGMSEHRIFLRFDLCHEIVPLRSIPKSLTASKTPTWVRSGAEEAERHHCSRQNVDPGRGSGSPREAAVGLRIVPLSVLRGLRRPHALRGWF